MKKTSTAAMLTICVAGASGQTLSHAGKVTGCMLHRQTGVTVLHTQTCAAWPDSPDMSPVCVGTLAC